MSTSPGPMSSSARTASSSAARLRCGSTSVSPRTANLLDQRDLDNYLLPLATRLSRSAAGGFASVWGTKQHAGSSFVRVEQATAASSAQLFDCCYEVRTGASSQSHAFKEQIRDQLASGAALPPGPVRMQISFTVGPGRNWMNLWKPTIDALGKILGNATTANRWAPLDGRIVGLGLPRSPSDRQRRCYRDGRRAY